jgi:hypothetical protein
MIGGGSSEETLITHHPAAAAEPVVRDVAAERRWDGFIYRIMWSMWPFWKFFGLPVG